MFLCFTFDCKAKIMQRSRGLVPTKINKDFVAKGDPTIKPQKDWTALIKRLDEKNKDGIPVTKLTEQISRKRAIGEKPKTIIKPLEKIKSVNKSAHDH
jgi:hypothetical protein